MRCSPGPAAFPTPRHAARGVAQRAIPTLALTGVQFTFLIGGTVLVERIFSYEGIGNMAIDAVINRDLPLIQGIILAFAVLFISSISPSIMTYASSIRGCAMAEVSDDRAATQRASAPAHPRAARWLRASSRWPRSSRRCSPRMIRSNRT